IQRFGDYLASPDFKNDVEDFMAGLKKLGLAIGRIIDLATGKITAAEFFSGSSSILSNETVKDPNGGPDYIKGSESDPNVWGVLKWGKQASGVAPTIYDKYFEEAGNQYGVDPKWLKSIAGIESSWDQNARGPLTKYGQAQGLMQVMPMNFQQGEDPFNPRDNIMAGARVLAEALKWSAKNSTGSMDEFDEALRYYNGGVRRGSKENNEYPGKFHKQYAQLYGEQRSSANTPSPETSEIARNIARSNQLLQQSIDSSRNSGGSGIIVYNNTGGNAVVTSAQLGAR
ncbi:lytic transglycosylase domain-containing protein, partial [Salmonella enterica subsp. diarizonae]|nr:lytic transglycosylase domain-containing protein [Salmonella enterica subsp. diarizonae]